MRLLSFELWQSKRRGKNINKKPLESKRIEYRIVLELKDKLEILLAENDRVFLEINPKVVGEFINILSDKLLSMYDFEQVDANKFIFYNKEISL